MDQKIIDDLDANVSKVNDVKAFLDRLYYDQEFSTVFNRPVLSMLISACDYLSSNIALLKTKYLAR